ncbi:MAG: hypothetical protein GXY41_04825 [Phycisphaerae bacterium]|nr:hypothetical protein [Phycisphaerae bacterium]
MKPQHKSWAYPAVVLLAVSSLAIAVLHSQFKQNTTPNDENPSSRLAISAYDPNMPDPDGGVPTLAPATPW